MSEAHLLYPRLHLLDVHLHVRLPAALVAFYRHRNLIQAAHVHPSGRPRIKVILDGDCAARTFLRAHAPILVEGGVADDGRLIFAERAIDFVGPAVALDSRESIP